MTQSIPDVAVIGAGIIGTSIAERLQHEGKQVLLIDRTQPGEGCSKGNAGHFATDIILPLANFKTLLTVPKLLMDPTGPLTLRWSYFPKLLPWLTRFTWAAMPHKASHTIEALKVLNRPSIDKFKSLLKRTSLEALMTQKGALTVYQTEAAAKKNKQHAIFVRQHGVNVNELNGDEIREMEPSLNSSIIGGLYYPDTAHSIEPYHLVTGLADCFKQNGGQFAQQEVISIDLSDKSCVQLKTEQGVVKAKEVILACGAWSKKLASGVGHNVPLETERGYHLMLPAPEANLTRPVSSFERSFVMTPMQEGLRLAGTVELAGLDAPEDYARSTALFNHASSLIDKLSDENATKWMGHRPSLPDSLPVIDRSSIDRRMLFAFGHQHLGLTQAAMTADLMADLILCKQQSVDIKPYSIERF